MRNLKSLIFGLAALCLAFGLVFTVSAFKSTTAVKRAPVYFKYLGSTFDELAYRNINNWQQTTAPEEEACIGDSDICILIVDSENLSAPGSMLDKLEHFFETDLEDDGDVAAYVNTPANREAEQN